MKNFFLRNPSRFFLVVAVVFALLIGPAMGSVANAEVGPDGSGITTVNGVFNLIFKVFDILFWLLIVGAGVFIVMAAFSYLTAGGDPEKIKVANQKVIYAAVAVVVAVLAKSIPSIVCDFLGTNCDPVNGPGPV